MHARSRPARSALRWTVGIAIALSASGALAACGSDDDDDTVETSAVTETTGAPETTGGSETTGGPETTGGSETTDAPETTGGGDEPVPGGTLTYAHFTDIRGFDPAIGQVNSQFAIQNYALYDVLVHENPTSGETVFGLLESAESEDALTWTLTLKPGLEFTDGTPLNAEAVKFNWERLKDPATAAVTAAQANSVASIEVVDDTTFTATLARANSQFLRTISTSALTWIGSPAAIQADPAGFSMKPVGAGPYTLKEFLPGSHQTFVRNPDYHGTTYVDEFTVKIITDEAQRLAALQSGEADIMFTLNGVTANQATAEGYESATSSPAGGYVLFFNTKRAPFDDLKVRQAFQLAFDTEEMNETLYQGSRTVASNLFLEDTSFYDAKYDQPEPDAAAAQALFDEIAEETGAPLEVTLQYTVVFTPEAQWFQTKMSGFDNVEVNLEETPSAEFQQRYISGDVEFGIFSYNILDPNDLTRYIATGTPLNFSQTSEPDIDAAIAAGSASLDEEERVAIYAPVQQYIHDEVPFSFLLRQQAWDFHGENVHGLGPDSRVSSSGLMKITEVWVTEE